MPPRKKGTARASDGGAGNLDDLPVGGTEEGRFSPERHGFWKDKTGHERRQNARAAADSDERGQQTALSPDLREEGDQQQDEKFKTRKSKKRKRKPEPTTTVPPTSSKKAKDKIEEHLSFVKPFDVFKTSFSAYTDADALKAELSLALKLEQSLSERPAFSSKSNHSQYLAGLKQHIAILIRQDGSLGPHYIIPLPSSTTREPAERVLDSHFLVLADKIVADADPDDQFVTRDLDFTDLNAVEYELEHSNHLRQLLKSDKKFQARASKPSIFYRTVQDWIDCLDTHKQMLKLRQNKAKHLYREAVRNGDQTSMTASQSFAGLDKVLESLTNSLRPYDDATTQKSPLTDCEDAQCNIQASSDKSNLEHMRKTFGVYLSEMDERVGDADVDVSNTNLNAPEHAAAKKDKFAHEQAVRAVSSLVAMVDAQLDNLKKRKEAEANAL